MNPSGRPRIEGLREKYMGRLPEFFDNLIELTRSKNESISLAACREILDRLIGKPQISIDAVTTKFSAGAEYLVVPHREGRRDRAGREPVRHHGHVAPPSPVFPGNLR